MEYAVFKQQIMEQAKRILPQEEGYVITIVDQTEYGLGEMLIINKSDKEVVPGISMEEMYQDFSQNKKSIEEVIETIQDTVNTAFMMIPEIDGTQGIDFRDYDCIKDLLVVELERSEFNGEHLSHGIFEKQPIGALVLYLRLEQKNQLVMARLGRDVLEVCGVSQSTMMKQAMLFNGRGGSGEEQRSGIRQTAGHKREGSASRQSLSYGEATDLCRSAVRFPVFQVCSDMGIPRTGCM